ncbi:MAG: phosphatidate cytidylyltransferase, partial [Pirellulaceae bacterium]
MTVTNLLMAQAAAPLTRFFDTPTKLLLSIVFGLLVIALLVIYALRRQPESFVNPAVRRTFELRVRAWCMMFAILVAGFTLGSSGTVVLFGLVSFWAMREYITMTPTRPADHKTLFWALFFFTPAQYLLVGWGEQWGTQNAYLYGSFSVLIPVYAS